MADVDPSTLDCTCPTCHARLWKQRGPEWTLANRILRFVRGGIVAKCPACGGDVPVPWLAVVPSSAPAERGPRLVVRLDGTRGA